MHMTLAVLIASTPGLYAWWSGRRLVHVSDHPLFSEFLLAHSGRVGRVFLLAWIATLLLGIAPGVMGFGVALLGILVGNFPSRRHIFEERWGLREYLGHNLRVLTVFIGPWLLVVFAPALLCVIARRHDGLPWIVAFGAVALTTIWSLQSRALLGLLGAAPITEPGLLGRFDVVLRRSHCKRPRILHAGTAGGLWVNGWAFPNPWAPAVLLTDDLVRALAPEETTAIFAHEVAHLEEFTTRRWVMRTLVPALLVFAIAALLTLDATSASFTRPLVLGWPILVLLALGASMSRARNHETASDLRAVELTGDPEALVRALTTIHALTRQPRRLPSAVEARATHPSLARRIQAIRARTVAAACGTITSVQPGDCERVLVRSADGDRTAVALLPDRLVWLEGGEFSQASPNDPSTDLVTDASSRATQTHTVPYAQMTELRVDASKPERPKLVFVTEPGKKRELPIHATDVERVQHVLDVVDGSLAKRPQLHANPVTSQSTARLAAAAAALAGVLPPWNGALALAGLVAMVWPARATLVAAGVTGLVGVAAAWLHGDAAFHPVVSTLSSPAMLLALQALASSVVLVLAGIRAVYRIEDSPRSERVGIAVILLLALAGCLQRLTSVLGPLPEMQLHLWARSNPALLILLVGSAAGLWVLREKRTRHGAGALVLVGILAATFGSTRFRDTCTRDLLRPTPPVLAAIPCGLEVVRTLHFEASVAALELSPAGRFVAVQLSSDSRPESAPPYFVVEGPHARRTVEGRLLRWADEHTVVTVSQARSEIESLVIRQVDIVDGTRIAVTCAGLVSADLQIRDGRWCASSRGRTGEEIVECSGSIGSSEVVERRWAVPRAAAPDILDTASDGRGNVLTCARSFPEGLGLASFVAASAQPPEQVWLATTGGLRKLGETALFPITLRASSWGSGFMCLATTSTSTEVWEIDPLHGAVTPRGRLAGSWYWSRTGGDPVLQRWGSPRVVVASGPERFYTVLCDSISGATCALTSSTRLVAARSGLLAISRSAGGQTGVTIFRLVPASAEHQDSGLHAFPDT
jgi:Zn-dependent protease with chaperone function